LREEEQELFILLQRGLTLCESGITLAGECDLFCRECFDHRRDLNELLLQKQRIRWQIIEANHA